MPEGRLSRQTTSPRRRVHPFFWSGYFESLRVSPLEEKIYICQCLRSTLNSLSSPLQEAHRAGDDRSQEALTCTVWFF